MVKQKVIDLSAKPKKKKITHEQQIERAQSKALALKKELKQINFKNESVIGDKLNIIANRIDKMLKIAYKTYLYKPGFGNSNSFVSLVNAMQNILANLRQLKTTEEQVDYIVDKIVMKSFTQALLQLQNVLISAKEGLSAQKKAQLNKAIEVYGEYLNASLEDVRKQISQFLS